MTARPGLAPDVALPRRRTVADLAADALREQILRGDLSEGEPLRQDAIALSLGMSRIPVREALRQLEAEGLVELNPHYGAVVSTLSLDEITELFDVRAVLEAWLMRRAVPRLTAEMLRHATDVLREYDAALRRGEMHEWVRLNWEFHSALLAAAGRQRTLALVQNLHHQSERYMRMQLAITHGEARARFEHRAILTAARKGDPALAARLTTAHVRNAGRRLVKRIGATRPDSTTGKK
jgi:DNA-binding GntR family transcriptional regulator